MPSSVELRAMYRDVTDEELREAIALGEASFTMTAWQTILAEAARRQLQLQPVAEPGPGAPAIGPPIREPKPFPEYIAFLVVCAGYAGMVAQGALVRQWLAVDPRVVFPPSLGLGYILGHILRLIAPGLGGVLVALAFGDTYPRACRFLLISSSALVVAFVAQTI